ncbi:unnamed protein product [Phytophthora fragariaefolia]|uniref:Unnamed protein product n=1 Tax=Phytophthora fragariaefolia TaxID=1490495 RepID=A0A9W6YPU9_9STRA|nr:unnamed protein product [Phytophthora fragariaefolia]
MNPIRTCKTKMKLASDLGLVNLVRRPHGVNVIGSKWVSAHKFDEHGNIVRYNARLVALGCLQTRGVDYYYTYSPVASTYTICVFLAVCCCKRLKIKLFDVETAFLNGTLGESVYMAVPQGIRADGGLACKLRRSLYGLKQAAAVWFKTIRASFVEMGFVHCRADPCLFVRLGKNGQSPVYIFLYVDDLLVGCATDAEADEIRDALSSRFTVKSLGDARFVLGMEIEDPMVLGQGFAPDDSHDEIDGARGYRELIGSLLIRQNTVALSSAEAEYMALALSTQEVLWLRYPLVEMGLKAEGPTTLQLANKSAIAMATNHGYTPRAKHIDLRAHFVRDHVEVGRIKLKHVPTKDQLADFLTKAMPTPRLMQLCDASGVVDVQVEGEC